MKRYLAALTILGFLAFGFGAFAQDKPAPQAKPKPGQQAPGPNAPMERLKAWLNLTPEQEAKLKDFQKARQEEQKAFGDQMKKLRDELAPLMKDSKTDQNKINGLIDQITRLSAERMKKGVQNGRNLEKIFTPEQLDKLKNARGMMRGLGQRLRGMGMGLGQGPGRGMGPGPMGRGGFMGPGMGRGMMGPGMGFGRGRGMMNRPGAMLRLRQMMRRWGIRR